MKKVHGWREKQTQSSSSKIVTSEAFQWVTDEAITGEPFKVWQMFGTTDEAQNFRNQKYEKHKIMEDRISFQKQKLQRSSF